MVLSHPGGDELPTWSLWMAGWPKFMDEEGTANAGLLDQAFAMQWFRENINLFGSSSSREVVFSILGRICAAD